MSEIIHDAILGTSPPWEMVNELIKLRLGWWTGGFVDQWSWDDSAVQRLSRADALVLYSKIKASE